MLSLYSQALFQIFLGNFFVYTANPESLFDSHEINVLNFDHLLRFAGIQDQNVSTSVNTRFNSNVDEISGSTSISNFKDNEYSQLKENSSINRNARNFKRPTLSSIFSNKYMVAKGKVIESYVKEIEKLLSDNVGVSNINSCLNNIFESGRICASEKLDLVEKVMFLIKKNLEKSSEKIDISKIIKNIITNDRCNIRVEKFLRDLYEMETTYCEKYDIIIQDIIKADKFDSIHFGIALFVLKNYSFDFITLIEWLNFSVKKIKENSVRDVNKLNEFLNLILSKIQTTENSFTLEKLRYFVINDLELFYMNVNLETANFFNQKLIHQNLAEWIGIEFVEVLFSTCHNFDMNFSSPLFLEKYFFFITKNFTPNEFEINSICRNNKFYTEFLGSNNTKWALYDSMNEMLTKNGSSKNTKKYLYENLDAILKFNHLCIRNIFYLCIKNNLIEIAAQLVEKLYLVSSFQTLNRQTIQKIFDARNFLGTNNPIDENCLFFILNFKYSIIDVHLKCYEIDKLIKVFEKFGFLSNNTDCPNQKLVLRTILGKTSNPVYIRKYLKAADGVMLQDIIYKMLETYTEKNNKEKNRNKREANLFNIASIVVALPIYDSYKISFLKSLSFSFEEVSMLEAELENILSQEEALDKLISILNLAYNPEIASNNNKK